jgi:2,4-dienoyl-CoA reductase (NADPH2)
MRDMTTFGKLLEPGYIGKVKTRNRMIKTGAGTSFIEKDGTVGETMKGFYESLAKGGVGMIIVESTGVDYPLGVSHIQAHAHLDEDKFIPGYSELTRVIHKHGCPAFIQLLHSGPWHRSWLTGLPPLAASALSQKELDEFGLKGLKELTVPEVGEVVEKFIKAAERAQKAGFDGVEINANSTHLLNTFLSRVWNRRQDKYGMAYLDNRARMMMEIVEGVKKRLGQDFGVIVLLTGAEYGIANGITSQESTGFAQRAQAAGADAIQIRPYGYNEYKIIHPGPERVLYPERPRTMVNELDWSRNGAGAFVPLAAGLKQAIAVSVITVGRLDPKLGEQILREGKADFIGLHRRLLADPELPNKVAQGKLEDIAPCTACYYCWHERINARYIKCRINTALGKEKEYEIQPTAVKKKVLIIGGGPAGMEAARVAALRGHDVTLCEKDRKLGGSLYLAGIIKGFGIEDMTCITSYLGNQVNKLGVKIKLGKEVTPAVVAELKPEVAIIATGGIPTLPAIPGIENPKVRSSSTLNRQINILLRFFSPKTLSRLTRIWLPFGKKVIIIGGGIHGCQLAEFLADRNRKVTIVETSENIGEGLIPNDTKERLLSWLAEKGVTIIRGVKYNSISEQGLTITDKAGRSQVLQADAIIPALPLNANPALLKELEKTIPEVYSVGDCREPLLSADAIADGAKVGHKI